MKKIRIETEDNGAGNPVVKVFNNETGDLIYCFVVILESDNGNCIQPI